MKKHERARRLAELISPYLYSTNSPPKELNELFLRWVDKKYVPTIGEILEANHAAK